MLFDVVTLRRDGAKKSPAESSVTAPQRLTLTVQRQAFSAAGPGGAHTVVDAYPSRGPYRPQSMGAPTLIATELTRLRGDSFVLVGSKLGQFGSDAKPQAWWCRWCATRPRLWC